MILRNLTGFGFNIVGILWSIGDKSLCGYLCKNSCSISNTVECSLLLLFVGIILVVCGASIVLMGKNKLIRKIIKRK